MNRILRAVLICIGIFSIYLAISLSLFWPRWQNATTHFGPPDLDTDGTLWYQWTRIFTERRQINFAYTNELFAFPFGYDVSYIPYFSLVYEIHILIMKALGSSLSDVLLVANTSTLLSFPLSAFAAFGLTFYITRRIYSSFISGLIYGYSFYHVLMMGGSLSLNHIEFIPLFYLSLLYFIDKPKLRSLLFSVLAFLVLFMSNAYWAFFSLVFTPLFFCFYGKANLSERMRMVMLYYPTVLFSTVVANIEYVMNQLYNLSPYHLQYVFPKLSSPRAELLNTLSFFAPSVNSVARPWFYSRGDHFLGYAALGLSVTGFFIRKKHRYYALFLGCLLFAILLASKVSPFIILNELYFQYFRAFRAVSRLVILASLFLGILSALSLDKLTPFLTERLKTPGKKKLLLFFALLLPIVIVLEGFTMNGQNRRLTSFVEIAQLYAPLRENDDIKRIIGYPLTIPQEGDGFPQNYQILGQMIHGKTLVGGISRFNSQARGFQEYVKDLSDPQTISMLAERKIDTIVLYLNLEPSAFDHMENLKLDDRLEFLGVFEEEKDRNTYVSVNDQSRNIAVFQIKSVVQENKSQSARSNEVGVVQIEGNTTVEKVSAVEYKVNVKNVSGPFTILLDEPYTTNWQLYPLMSSSLGNLAYLFQTPVGAEFQTVYQESVNSWQIDPKTFINSLPPQSYRVNADGSFDMDLVLFFQPAAFQTFSQAVRALFFTLIFGLLAFDALSSFISFRKNSSAPSKE